jgi:hypothetical protein
MFGKNAENTLSISLVKDMTIFGNLGKTRLQCTKIQAHILA